MGEHHFLLEPYCNEMQKQRKDTTRSSLPPVNVEDLTSVGFTGAVELACGNPHQRRRQPGYVEKFSFFEMHYEFMLLFGVTESICPTRREESEASRPRLLMRLCVSIHL